MRSSLRLALGIRLATIVAAGGSLAVAAAPLAAQAARASAARQLRGVDAFVERTMKEWQVPGLAVAVVRDGEVVLSKGYGHRDLERRLPVTPGTLFAIGSITKSFTVSVLGMLADEGKLDWDKPVRTYLPDFQLKDPVATEHMTPRDLVTHRSGLPRHDALWYGSDLTRREMYERLRHLEPSKDFRSVYQYQNLMFMTGGYLAEQIAGASWEDIVRRRIFGPLGMSRSTLSVTTMQQADDHAQPYLLVDSVVRRVPFRNLDEVGPAGSINSSVEEMSRYVRFHLAKGKHGEEQFLSAAAAQEMQTPQMVIPGPVQYAELGHASYGMGFVISTYRGRKLVSHGGGIDGFISLLSFLPDEGIGVIVLTNLSGNNPVPTLVTRNLLDRLQGLDQVDWASRVREQQRKARETEAKSRAEEASDRKSGTSRSHPLADYAGEYEHPGYGRLEVGVADSVLEVTFNDMTVRLDHHHYDVFAVPRQPMLPIGGAKLQFFYDKKGEIDRVAVPLEPAVGDIVFTRAPEAGMASRAFLEPFVGEYELAGTVLTVALRGDSTLTLTVPGQPTYTLVPSRGTSFEIQGLSGFTIEFRQNAAGQVTELVSRQPNGTFVATRKRS